MRIGKVFINPGHAPYGDPDPGAVNPMTGLREADVAWEIGKITNECLQAAGLETYILQSDSLSDVVITANDWCADIFVSIHCNAGGGTGTETFYHSGSAQGRELAKCVQMEVVDSLGTVNRGIKTGDGLFVIRKTDMPSILVETAFIDRADDERLLADMHIQREFGRAIARGITDFGLLP